MVKLIDDCVGKILSVLEKKGVIDDTIIVFTTDHGDYNGEHGLFEKNMLYESVYHLPFLIRWPEKINKETVVDEYISLVDFQQTLLGLLGVEPCGKEEGCNASPLLQGEKINWVDEIFIYTHLDTGAGIITPEYELAYMHKYHSYEENGPLSCKIKPPGSDGILFDRIQDPYQENNLINNPTYKKVLKKLHNRLVEHNRAVESPTVKWLENAP
jgi:arylsulfatase A-like enzyme